MTKPLSDDLRCRILEAYQHKEGSQPQLAQRFGVSFEYVRKIRRQWRRRGTRERVAQLRHGPQSRISEPVKEQLRAWLQQQPERTLAELGEQLRSRGVEASRSRISQVLRGLGLRLKKSPSTPKSVIPRPTASGAKSSSQPATMPLEKLIFLAESGVTTQMTRPWGRAPKGEPIAEATPGGPWKVRTTLGALRLRGIGPTMTIESATDGEVFSA